MPRSFPWRHRTWRIALLLSGGCASIPRGAAAIDDVRIEGNHQVSAGDIEEKLATAASPRFLGLFRGVVFDYQLLDRHVLDRDLARVERFYRARGFYEARARAGRVVHQGRDHVDVTIVVEEGRPVTIGEVRVDGLLGLYREEIEAARAALRGAVAPGMRFEEAAFEHAEKAMKRALTDRGYAWATVERQAEVDLASATARVHFVVRPGPKASFGPVTIEGLGDLPEEPLRRALDLSEGERYSTAALDAAQQAALDLGTFASVELTPQLAVPPPPNASVPVRVKVRRQKLRSLLLGIGAELDPIRAQVRLRVGWEHRNLFGGFRSFAVSIEPTLDLYPTRLPGLQAPTALLPGEKFSAQLRHPGFIEARTSAIVRAQLDTYPVLLSPEVDPNAPVLGYVEVRGTVGLERSVWRVFVAPTYNFQWNGPFAYEGTLDRDLHGVVVSYVDLLSSLDLRNDRVRPHSGLYFQADVQLAGGVLGGDAQDVRIQPEVRGYVPLGPKVTLALRGTVGFLFPQGYGDATSLPGGAADRARQVRDIQLVYLRGFFSGGPTSNRGYPLRGVGPHGSVPFFNPGLAAQELANACRPTDPGYDPIRCGLPLGGLSLWEASLELRFPIVGALSGSTFCDASDVSSKRVHLRLDHPHLSCGVGLRYETPIGPLRLDIGCRIPGLQVPAGEDPRVEGVPGTILGAPVAFAFGIGEAF